MCKIAIFILFERICKYNIYQKHLTVEEISVNFIASN